MKIGSIVHYNTVGLEVLVIGFPCSRPVLLSKFYHNLDGKGLGAR